MKQRSDTGIFRIKDPAKRKAIERAAADDSVSHDRILDMVRAAGANWSLRGVSEWRERVKARSQAAEVVGFFSELFGVLESQGVPLNRAAVGVSLIKLAAFLKDQKGFTPDMMPALVFLQRTVEHSDRVAMFEAERKAAAESKASAGVALLREKIRGNKAAEAALLTVLKALDNAEEAQPA